MGDTSLQDRLRDHSKAFDGLLSLIPAKMYYGEDTSDQWKRKKQTKAEAKAARRGKLDPDSEMNRNAKEVMDERARNKRKLQEIEEDDDESTAAEDDESDDLIGVEKEKPLQGLEKKRSVDEEEEKVTKKPKLSEDAEVSSKLSKKQAEKEERRLLKKQKKEEKKAQKPASETTSGSSSLPSATKAKPSKDKSAKKTAADTIPVAAEARRKAETVAESTEVDEDDSGKQDGEMQPIDVSGLVSDNEEVDGLSDSTPVSAPHSPVFDEDSQSKNATEEAASTATSISSTVPPSEKPRHITIPADTTALRARLAAKIEALRAARKADDKPIRTRQELIESRREKQTQRKAHKKEMRRIAKEEEEQKREEALASARTSPGSILSPVVDFGDEDDGSANHFAFGRVAFADGTQMSHDLSYEKSSGKKKGPLDPKSALAKLQAQKSRIAGLDDDKRKEVLEKETWLAARRRVEGEKIHDNEALLKKTIKRHDKEKKKSEREWKDRKSAVAKGIKDRQRKRDDNIKKRRDDKVLGKAGKKKKGGATKPKSRPGFEGSFGVGRRK